MPAKKRLILAVSAVSLFLAASVFAASKGKPGGNIYELMGTPSDSWQVFLDDEPIAAKQGVRKVMHSPERFAGNPLITSTSKVPWETKGISNAEVIYDPSNGWFHLYYRARARIPGKAEGAIDNDAYARSRDGINWERPELGLVEFSGVGTRNNLFKHESRLKLTRLNVSPQPPSPAYHYIDPNATSPDRRYVKLYEEDLPSGGWSDYAAVSADGFTWHKASPALGDLRKTHTRAQVSPATSTARYVWVRQNWVDGDPAIGRRVRGVYRMESNDLVTWTGGTWVFPSHAAHFDRYLEDYGMSAGGIAASKRYRGLLLNFYPVFHTDGKKKLSNGLHFSGPLEPNMAVSRDTIRFERIGWPQPFLPLGKPGEWDDGMILLSPTNVIEYGDRLLFYYGGFDGPHEDHQVYQSGFGLATLRRDGFVSLQAEGGEGMVTTKPLKVTGKKLELNAEGSGGPILVEVLDEAGKPIRGFFASECKPVTGDGVEQKVSWKRKKDLASLKGTTASLRFTLQRGAKLYAYRFSD